MCPPKSIYYYSQLVSKSQVDNDADLVYNLPHALGGVPGHLSTGGKMKKMTVLTALFLSIALLVGGCFPIGGGGDIIGGVDALFGFVINAECSRLVHFDASGSISREGTIEFYEWFFGDGEHQINGANNNTAEHLYAGFGEFTVRLVVTNSYGDSAELSVSVVLSPVGPTARFTNTEQVAVGGGTKTRASFSAETSVAENINSVLASPVAAIPGLIVSAKWWFGDGTGIEGAWDTVSTVDHTYNADGVYTVTVTITDVNGLTSTRTKNIRITRP
jgi:hypothetical protein